ncbi:MULTISPECIES: GlxA family transcriptional regulator [Oxalobacteraceae]|uniref:GlxA family transcriptional regulator n=1 Tax=Herminiimonas sp. Marseille-P9896 TaxID=2742211 RepID=UPI00158DC8AB|nr:MULTISPECIES: helix-turn-helix domain-containing protein [Oxalobacteraceae]
MEQMSFKLPALSESTRTIRHIGIIVFEGVILADVIGAADVFGVGDRLISSVFAGQSGYAISLLSLNGGIIRSSTCVQIMTLPLPPHDNHNFDTILIASGTGNFDAYRDPGLVGWLQDANANVRRIGAVCTGVFVMAAAGLLDQKRATTHWALQDKLIREFPQIKVERDANTTEDDGIFTASDVGMATDLALTFLEDDLGSSVAKRVAESLQVTQRRREQIPVRPTKITEPVSCTKIQQASRWFVEHMAEAISIIDAANYVSMSERNFQRQFKRETGWTPHEFLLHLRLDAVRQQLARTDLPVDKIARRCGFLNGEHVSKLFRKHLQISPIEYRRNERNAQNQAIEPPPVSTNAQAPILVFDAVAKNTLADGLI